MAKSKVESRLRVLDMNQLSEEDNKLLLALLEQHLSHVQAELKKERIEALVEEVCPSVPASASDSDKSLGLLDSNAKISRKETYPVLIDGEIVSVRLQQSIIKSPAKDNTYRVVEHQKALYTDDAATHPEVVLGQGSFGKVKKSLTSLSIEKGQLTFSKEDFVVKRQFIERKDAISDELWRHHVKTLLQQVCSEQELTRRAIEACETTTVRVLEGGNKLQVLTYMPNLGTTLSDYIKHTLASLNGVEHKEIIQTISLNLLRDLARIHSLGIIHRDIKPANILINPDTLDVHIIDFGLALDTSSTRRQRAGTPLYMCLKQYLGIANEKTDLYGMLLVLEECITGKLYNPELTNIQRVSSGKVQATQYHTERSSLPEGRATYEFSLHNLLSNLLTQPKEHYPGIDELIRTIESISDQELKSEPAEDDDSDEFQSARSSHASTFGASWLADPVSIGVPELTQPKTSYFSIGKLRAFIQSTPEPSESDDSDDFQSIPTSPAATKLDSRLAETATEEQTWVTETSESAVSCGWTSLGFFSSTSSSSTPCTSELARMILPN